MLLSPARTLLALSSPIAFTSAFCSSDGGRNVVYVAPVLGLVFVWRKAVNGSEKECGMWPEESPGRGSGSAPVNLRWYSYI